MLLKVGCQPYVVGKQAQAAVQPMIFCVENIKAMMMKTILVSVNE
jgi:hypothetical protein